MAFETLKTLSKPDFDSKMEPFLTQFLSENAAALAGKTVDHKQALNDMYDLVHGTYQLHWETPSPEELSISALQISSQCVSMIVTVSVDVLMVFIGLLGVPDSVARATAIDLMKGLSEEEMTGLETLIQAIADADGITNQAKAMAAFMMSFYKITGIRQILGALEHNMAWYEWVLMGATITAQIVAWVATDFLAAIAEIVLETAAVAQTVADAITCVQDCSQS